MERRARANPSGKCPLLADSKPEPPQPLAQQTARAVDANLDGLGGKSERGGDFLVGLVLDRAEHKRGSKQLE